MPAATQAVRLGFEPPESAVTFARKNEQGFPAAYCVSPDVLVEVATAEYLSTWFAGVRVVTKRGEAMAPTTEADYACKMDRISEHIGHVQLSKLTDTDVTRVRDALLVKGLKPRTVAGTLSLLGQALRPAVRKGLLRFNPADADAVNRPTNAHDPERAVMTLALAKKTINAAEDSPIFLAPVALALGSSLRREEVLGLRWQDTDLESATVRVEQTVTVVAKAIRGDREAIHIGPPKTDHSRRTIPLDPRAAEMLRRHKAAQNERRLKAGATWEDNDLVVDRGDGRHWNPSTFTTAWREWAKAHGLRGPTDSGAEKQLTFHALRAGFSTLGGAAGQDARTLADVMGHTDSRFTERVYQDVLMERKREAVGAVWSLIDS